MIAMDQTRPANLSEIAPVALLHIDPRRASVM